MKKYEAYKDSGIEWIGMIPEGWSIERIKFQCNVTDGTHFSPQTADEGKPYVTVANVNNNKIDVKGALLISLADFETLVKQGCQPAIGDVLLAKDGTVGRSAVVEDNNDFVCLSSLGILHPNDGLVSKFLKYTLDSSILQDQMSQAMAGSALRRITIAKIKEFIFLLPEKAEQQAIADYLDYKVGQIDTSVAGINTQIEDLKAYRQSVISEAVTKGLNPDAPMKDSGIEWIGMIPEGWDSLKVKNIFSVIAGATPDSTEDSFWNGEVVWVTPADFKSSDHYISVGKRCITQQGYESCGTTLVPAGSIVVSKRAPIGSVVIARNELCTNQGCLSCVPTKRANSNYYYFALSVFTQALEMYGSGTTFKEISAFDFSNFRIPYPPLAEQQAIADYLDEKTSKIDTAIKSLENQRDDLNALRQTVISEAVTGKIDLRDWKK